MKANIPWFNCLIKPAIQTFESDRERGEDRQVFSHLFALNPA